MTKAEDIARRWLESDKGMTPQREAKARAAARRMKVDWADVERAVEQIKANRAAYQTE